MSPPVQVVLLVLGLIASARIRLNAVVLGQPVSVPLIGLLAVVMVLALAVMILFLLRGILRDGGWLLRPRVVNT